MIYTLIGNGSPSNCAILAFGLYISMSWMLKYGEFDFSKFTPSGKFNVGYKAFVSKAKMECDCSIFYPTSDEIDEDADPVTYWVYGYKQLLGFRSALT